MGFYRFADRVFELKNRYRYTEERCADYLTENPADYVIELSDAEIERERVDDNARYPEGYLEFIAFHRKVTECLSCDNCVLMHGAAMKCRCSDGSEKAYIFTAKSGTGKTTHISLWKRVYGDAVNIINGDKPYLRRKPDGGFTVYGTPWCGKELMNENSSAELGGIVLLTRAEKNSIDMISPSEAVPFLMGQLFYKNDAAYIAYLLETLNQIVKKIPIYKLGCNMEEEAAVIAYSALCGKR